MKRIFKLPLLAGIGLAVAIGTLGMSGISSGRSVVYADGDAVTIDQSNFFDYFDADGKLKETTSTDFVFVGDFGELGISEILLPYDNMSFTAEGAVFENTAFIIDGNSISFDGIHIYDSELEDVPAITVSGSDDHIDHCYIEYTNTGNSSAVHFTNTARNRLDLNQIVYTGNNGDSNSDELITNIVVKCDSESIQETGDMTVFANTITATMPACEVTYDQGMIDGTYHSGGVVVGDINGIEFTENVIDIALTSTLGNYPSVVGASLNTPWDYGLDDETGNIIAQGNTITISEAEGVDLGSCYSYGIKVAAEKYNIDDNNILINDAPNGYAISLSSPCEEGSISGNALVINSEFAYGVYANAWLQPLGDMEVIENTVTTNGDFGCGLYALLGNAQGSKHSSLIKDNTFTGIGSFIYGIRLVGGDEAGILNNTIESIGTDQIPYDGFPTYDLYTYHYDVETPSGTVSGEQYLSCGIYIEDTEADVYSNTVDCTGIAIAAAHTCSIWENIVNTNTEIITFYAVSLEERVEGENVSHVSGNTLFGWDDTGVRVSGDKAVKKTVNSTVESNYPIDIEEATVTIPSNSITYNGETFAPVPTVTLGDEVLVEGEDYFACYADKDGNVITDPTDAGEYYVGISGLNKYTGRTDVPFTIKPVKISTVTLKKSSLPYSGSARTQSPTVQAKVNGELVTLTKGTKTGSTGDYYLTFSNNLNVGTATVTVTGKGNFTGSIKKTYKILPKGSSIVSLTPASKAVTVKWKKQATKMSKGYITGYQIQFATDKNFTKNKKTFTVKGYSITGKKASGLLAGKTYYVRIRTYKTVSGTNYYSDWATVKTVKTK